MVVYCENAGLELERILGETDFDKAFLFTDENVQAALGGRLPGALCENVMAMSPGESNKTLATAAQLWTGLGRRGATRRSLLVNFGGGVVTDLGGFAAATFKRGIRFVNVPTSLLAMADASVGGKTGIDFNGLKNEVGVFAEPLHTVISMALLDTLPAAEMRSGLAEIMKMALICSRADSMRMLAGDALADRRLLGTMLRTAVEEKERIVSADPHEKGLRKTLNFGHTAGHAFESFLLSAGRPVSHGEAVAHGMLVALVLSHLRLGMEAETIHMYREQFLRKYYPRLRVSCADIPALVDITARDKKNVRAGEALFTLLREPGRPEINRPVPPDEIAAAIEIALQ